MFRHMKETVEVGFLSQESYGSMKMLVVQIRFIRQMISWTCNFDDAVMKLKKTNKDLFFALNVENIFIFSLFSKKLKMKKKENELR